MTLRERILDFKRISVEGYQAGRLDFYSMEDSIKLRIDANKKDGAFYLLGALTGGTVTEMVESLEDKSAHFMMGYAVSEAKYNDDGFTPFAKPIDQLEEMFGSRKLYDLGVLAFGAHKKVGFVGRK